MKSIELVTAFEKVAAELEEQAGTMREIAKALGGIEPSADETEEKAPAEKKDVPRKSASSMEQVSTTKAPAADKKAPAEGKKAETPEEKEESRKAPTIKELRLLMMEISDKGRTDEVKKALTDLGATRLSKVDPEKYQELYDRLQMIAKEDQ